MNIKEKKQEILINLTIDGQRVQVPKGTTVYTASKKTGVEIPVFCYLDRMPPFGACRMCLVEVEKMAKLQTSCTLEAAEGMVVKTQTALAKEGRKDIIEFLLLNHPLDCPICDRGGECPLQDNALEHGPGKSRFYEEKRRFKKPIPLGPVLMLDRERCIVCARCTRFSDLLSGDHALEFIDRGFKTEVGTPNGGPAESKFIGNTIMICPVGALTSQVYRFRARPWDNDTTQSTCTLCPVGCSLSLDSRDGQIMRTRSFENKQVNDIWLCDKGWFGYEFSMHPDRLTHPLIKRNGQLEKATWDEALSLIAKKMKQAQRTGQAAAFGGNALTFEENYLFQKLMRQGMQVHHVDHRIGMPLLSLEEEGLPPGMQMTIGECEELSFAVLVGLDLTEEFPVIWLRLRQAINKGAKVVYIGHFSPEIAPYLSRIILHAPGDEIEKLQQYLPEFLESAKDKKAAFFVGRQYLNTQQRREILSELTQATQESPQVTLNIMEGEGNSMGARLAGMRPDSGPFGENLPAQGLDAHQVLEQAAQGSWDFLYVAGSNPAVKFSSDLWNKARANLEFLVVNDLFLTETAKQADVVLPTLSFVEKGGSFINIEGRVQALMPGKDVPANIYSDAEIFMEIAKKLDIELELEAEYIEKLMPNELLLPKNPSLTIQKEKTEDERKAEGLRATFTSTLFDHGVRMQHDPHLIWTVKEPQFRLRSSEADKRGVKEGDTVRISMKDQFIVAKVKYDERVAEQTVIIPLGFEKEIPAYDLAYPLFNGLPVEMKIETEIKSPTWGVKNHKLAVLSQTRRGGEPQQDIGAQEREMRSLDSKNQSMDK